MCWAYPFMPSLTSRGIWPRRLGLPDGWTCWTGLFWPGTCPAAPQSCCGQSRGDGVAVRAEILGGTTDISAGQLIDRTGVLLGLQFPAGKALDALSGEADTTLKYRVKRDGLRFSLSGMENQVKKLLADGEKPANIARFTIETVTDVILRTTRAAQEAHPGLPVLCSGGVASNRRLREALEEGCGAVFAQPQYATDNAMGTAILTWRAMEREAEG